MSQAQSVAQPYLAPPAVGAPLRAGAVTVAGVRSPVVESGPAAAREAAVFVHGNPGSSADWSALVAAVGQHGRAVALDMPGFGRADKPADFPYTVDGYAAHLRGALAALGVERAHLVLHDFGGPWGLAFAAAQPESVASLALLNMGILPGYSWHYLARIWRAPLLGELFMATATFPAFSLLLRHGNPRGLPAAFVRGMWAHYDRGTRRAVLRLYRATSSQHLAALQPRLAPLADRPALVLWGAHDPYLPVSYAERQREFFALAEVHLLADSGHWPHADNPEAVADLLVPFLARQLAGAAATQRGGAR